MKKLFIYYSLSGNGDCVAEYLSKNGFDVRRVQTAKKMPESFALQILKGGFSAGIGKKEKLKEYDRDVSGYDMICIGSPVWNGRITPAVNTVISELPLDGRDVCFILYAGGGEAPKAEKKIRKTVGGAGVVVLKEPKKDENELKKLDFLIRRE